MLRAVFQAIYRTFPEKLRRKLQPLIPMVLPFIDENERNRLRWMKTEYTPFIQASKEGMFISAVRFCNNNRPMDGYYFEFGSHSATTMRYMWHHAKYLFDWTYVSFDSFEGLPEVHEIDGQSTWHQGKFSMGEEELRRIMRGVGMPDEKLITVKGYYDKTLNVETAKRFANKKAVVIYIDCDLYASTVPVLEFIKDFLQIGTIIVFDDWFCMHARPDRGERRAWAEFREKYPNLRFTEFVKTFETCSFIYVGDDNTQKESDMLAQSM